MKRSRSLSRPKHVTQEIPKNQLVWGFLQMVTSDVVCPDKPQDLGQKCPALSISSFPVPR